MGKKLGRAISMKKRLLLFYIPIDCIEFVLFVCTFLYLYILRIVLEIIIIIVIVWQKSEVQTFPFMLG